MVTESGVTTLEKIKYNLSALEGAGEEDLDIVKGIVCDFFRGGSCPECRGCTQPEDKVMECRDAYIAKIEARPMEKWTEEFSKLKVRERKPIKEIIDLGLQCDSCYLSDVCPMFEVAALCAIDWEEEGDLTPKQVLDKLIQIQFKRVNRAAKIEEIDGGVPDATLSGEMDRLTGFVERRTDLDADKIVMSLSAKSGSGGDGNAQKQGGGLLAKLLGGAAPAALPEAQSPVTIDVPAVEVKTVEKKDVEN